MQNDIIAGIIVAVVSALVTWIISQATSGRKVMAEVDKWREEMNKVGMALQRSENDIERMRDANMLSRKEISDLRLEVSNRIMSVTTLVEKVIDNSRELIEIVKVQNELLRSGR